VYRSLVARLFGVGGVIGVGLALGAMLAGRPFLRLAYAPDYGAYLTAFVLVTVGASFALINSLSYFAMVAIRRPGLLLTLQCVGTAVTAVTSAILIPHFAVAGAAAAVCLGRAIVCVVTAVVLLRAPTERQA
jgi:O-antigen/teichoic acid export membrane protein